MSRKASVGKKLHHENFLGMKCFMSRPFLVTHSCPFHDIVNEEVLIINISFMSIALTRKKFVIAIVLVIKIIMSWSFSLCNCLIGANYPLCCVVAGSWSKTLVLMAKLTCGGLLG